MPWKATARCEIGVSHLQRGIPCQDYCDFRVVNDVLVGIIADGAGSSQASDLGAYLTVQSCLDFTEEIEAWLKQDGYEAYRLGVKPLPVKIARFFFQKAMERVLRVLRDAAQEKNYCLDDLASTLLMFIATPDWIAAMQIGDGLLVIQPQAGDYQLVFMPDKGEFANQTTFVTSSDALNSMQVRVIEDKMKFISAMTDGLEAVAIRYSDWSPFAPFFDPLQKFITEDQLTDSPIDATTDVAPQNYLKMFLCSDRLNQKTSDDKSLILCLYEPDHQRQ